MLTTHQGAWLIRAGQQQRSIKELHQHEHDAHQAGESQGAADGEAYVHSGAMLQGQAAKASAMADAQHGLGRVSHASFRTQSARLMSAAEPATCAPATAAATESMQETALPSSATAPEAGTRSIEAAGTARHTNQTQAPASSTPSLLLNPPAAAAAAAAVAGDVAETAGMLPRPSTAQCAELGRLIAAGRQHESLGLVLSTHPPSRHWAHAAAQSTSAPQTAAAAASVEARGAATDEQWTALCEQLHAWACSALTAARPEVPLSAMHADTLTKAAESASSGNTSINHLGNSSSHDHHGSGQSSGHGMRRNDSSNSSIANLNRSSSGHGSSGSSRAQQAWWRVAGQGAPTATIETASAAAAAATQPAAPGAAVEDAAAAAHVRLIAAVYRLAADADGAWLGVLRSLWHSLATVAPLDAATQEALGSPISHTWDPHTTAKRLTDLATKQHKVLKKLLGSHPPPALDKELADCAKAIMPRTYLQLVGQKLLLRLAGDAPLLLTLPTGVPGSVVACLYGRPFADALRVALHSLMHDPSGDLSAFMPSLPTSAAPMTRGFRRIYPTEASITSAGNSKTHQGTSGGVMGSSRAALSVLASISRDVQEFQAGVRLPLERCCAGPGAREGMCEAVATDTEVVLREARPVMMAVISDHMVAAAQAHLHSAVPDASLPPIPVTDDIWPDTDAAVSASAAAAATVADPDNGCSTSEQVQWTNNAGQRTLFSTSSQMRRSMHVQRGSRHLTHQQSSMGRAGSAWGVPGQLSTATRASSVTATTAASGELSGKLLAASLTAAAGELATTARAMSMTGMEAAPGELSRTARAASVTAGPIRWGRLSSSNSRGHNSTGDVSRNGHIPASPHQPRCIRACHHQLLSMLGLTLNSLQCFLPEFQTPVAIAVLDTLQCIMDTLVVSPASAASSADRLVSGTAGKAGDKAGDTVSDTAEAAWQRLSAAQCVLRRLQAFSAAFDAPQRDELYQQMYLEHSEAVARATALVDSLQTHCVQQQLELVRVGVCSALEAADWGNAKPMMKWAKGPLPAVRMWQVLVAALVHGCVQVLAPVTAAHVIEEVLAGSLAMLAPPLAAAAPSPARLQSYTESVALLCTAAWLLARAPPEADGIEDLSQPLLVSGSFVPAPAVQLAPAAVSRLAGACRDICVKAVAIHDACTWPGADGVQPSAPGTTITASTPPARAADAASTQLPGTVTVSPRAMAYLSSEHAADGTAASTSATSAATTTGLRTASTEATTATAADSSTAAASAATASTAAAVATHAAANTCSAPAPSAAPAPAAAAAAARGMSWDWLGPELTSRLVRIATSQSMRQEMAVMDPGLAAGLYDNLDAPAPMWLAAARAAQPQQ